MASMFDNVKALGRVIGALPASADTEAPKDVFATLNADARQLHNLKQRLLNEERDQAFAAGRQPTLEGYRLRALAFAETEEGRKMVEDGRWSETIAADLSATKPENGYVLEGFLLNEPKKGAPQDKSAIAKNIDALDLDGDGKINVQAADPFYDYVALNNAQIKSYTHNGQEIPSIVDPAESFKRQIGTADKLDGVCFRNMNSNNSFELTAGNYNNITLEKMNCGELVLGEGTKITGLTLNGVQGSIRFEKNASLKEMKVDKNTRLVKLTAKPGASIVDSDFGEATISMSSELQHTTWQNVTINGNIDGVDLSGASLSNVKINGIAITSTEQLKQLGATVSTQKPGIKGTDVQASPEFIAQAQRDAAMAKMKQAAAKAAPVADAVKQWSTELKAPKQQPAVAQQEPKQHVMQAPILDVKVEAPAPVTANIQKAEVTEARITQRSHYQQMNADANRPAKEEKPTLAQKLEQPPVAAAAAQKPAQAVEQKPASQTLNNALQTGQALNQFTANISLGAGRLASPADLLRKQQQAQAREQSTGRGRSLT